MRDHDGPTVVRRVTVTTTAKVAQWPYRHQPRMDRWWQESCTRTHVRTSTSINDTNINDYIKDTFLDCVAGRKLELITYDFTETTNIQLNTGLNVCVVSTARREKKSWMIHCEDGDVVDITSDALKDDVTETLNE